jgi:hypothetical protein
MTDLVEFLRAALDEDERVARAAMPGPWTHNPAKEWFTDLDKLRAARAGIPQSGGEEFVKAEVDGRVVGVAATGPADDPQSMADAAHIARHDPARVLAEVAAKRAILDLHESWPVLVETEFSTTEDADRMTLQMSKRIAWLTNQEYRARFGDEPPTSPIIRAMAQPYAGRPGWREEWATGGAA